MADEATKVIVRHEKDRNEVRFKGVITEKRSSRNLTTMTMKTTTLVNGEFETSYPSFAIFDDAARQKVDTIPLRVPVEVAGYVTTQKMTDEQRSRANALGLPQQSFVLEDVSICTDSSEDVNEITIVGAVDQYFVQNYTEKGKKGYMVHFIIGTIREGKYLKRIKVDYFTEDGAGLVQLMPRGTRVKAICHCSTRIYNTDAGSQKREFLRATSIEKA